MRLQHVCSCAACDFDKRMQETVGSTTVYVRMDHVEAWNKFSHDHVGFVYNMDEYTNVFVEVGLEWCQSYH